MLVDGKPTQWCNSGRIWMNPQSRRGEVWSTFSTTKQLDGTLCDLLSFVCITLLSNHRNCHITEILLYVFQTSKGPKRKNAHHLSSHLANPDQQRAKKAEITAIPRSKRLGQSVLLRPCHVFLQAMSTTLLVLKLVAVKYLFLDPKVRCRWLRYEQLSLSEGF